MKQHVLSAALVAACSCLPAMAQPVAQAAGQESAAVAAPAQGVNGKVTIRRDAHGMPHVYADTVYGIFYGYGYAVAQDRLFQMEMARRSTQGRVAEVLGASMVAFDKSIRGNFSPERIQRQLAALPAADRQVLDGYAAGMNAWLARIRAQPGQLMPKEFNDLGFAPADWTAYDVAMIFIGTMANRFSDANSEIDNLALLTALKDRHGEAEAMRIFNQLRWLTDSRAPTTVPPQEGSYQPAVFQPEGADQLAYALPRYDGTPPMLERVVRDPATRGVVDGAPATLRARLAEQYAQSGQPGIAGFPTTSNMWIVGRDHAKDARSILLNGPQFGWWNPAYTYGIGLHGAGFDVVGNTPFAYPSILFGHNAHVAWGSTAGFGDDVDIYAEKLDPADRNRYFHDGQWKTLEKRTDLILVKDAAPVTLDVYRSVHGLIVKFDDAQHVAYAKARAWEGFELQSLMAWTRKTQSANWEQWKAQAARHALTINWYYADDRGNIGWRAHGLLSQAPAGPRSAPAGAGHRRNGLAGPVAVLDQSAGLQPGPGVHRQLEQPADARLSLHRPVRHRLGAGRPLCRDRDAPEGHDRQRRQGQPATDVGPDPHHQLCRRQPPPFPAVPATSGAGAAGRRSARAAGGGAGGWDGMMTSEREPGYYDNAGPAVMDAWLRAMLKRTLADEMPADFFKWYSATGYPMPQAPATGSLNLTTGVKVLFNALAGPAAGVPQRYDFFNGARADDVILAALDDALAALRQAYGKDPAAWKIPAPPMVFAPKNFLGVPQADAKAVLSYPATQNRGTENNMTVFDGRSVRAVDVVAPGQSGFVAPDGTPSPHTRDQFDLYNSFGSKRVWFTADEVRRNATSEETLRYRR